MAQKFKTQLMLEREKRDMALYNDYNRMRKDKESSKTLIDEYLMKKYGFYSKATIWVIVDRVKKRLGKKKKYMQK